MSDVTPPQFPPIPIGAEARPPSVVSPEPATLFQARAARFRALAPGHQLQPYLSFLADLCEAQHAIQKGLPNPVLPSDEDLGRAVEFGMPAIARERFEVDDVVLQTLHRLFDQATDMAMPESARAALTRVRLADDDQLAGIARAVLAVEIPADQVAEHVWVGAGLQVHFARLAEGIDGRRLSFIADGVCPACGGAPATTSLVNWAEAERSRFCLCSLCATRWYAVRVKCVACSSTKGIHYKAIEGVSETIKAECCDECRSYVKILSEDVDRALEGIADDVASLGLDMLVREEGFRRAGLNLFLIGA